MNGISFWSWRYIWNVITKHMPTDAIMDNKINHFGKILINIIFQYWWCSVEQVHCIIELFFLNVIVKCQIDIEDLPWLAYKEEHCTQRDGFMQLFTWVLAKWKTISIHPEGDHLPLYAYIIVDPISPMTSDDIKHQTEQTLAMADQIKAAECNLHQTMCI